MAEWQFGAIRGSAPAPIRPQGCRCGCRKCTRRRCNADVGVRRASPARASKLAHLVEAYSSACRTRRGPHRRRSAIKTYPLLVVVGVGAGVGVCVCLLSKLWPLHLGHHKPRESCAPRGRHGPSECLMPWGGASHGAAIGAGHHSLAICNATAHHRRSARRTIATRHAVAAHHDIARRRHVTLCRRKPFHCLK